MQFVAKILLTLMTVCLAAPFAGATQTPREFPAPATVSPELRALIAAPPPSFWDLHPNTTQEWKAWVSEFARDMSQPLPQLREQLGVVMSSGSMAGVPVFTLSPKSLATENAERILLHFHGGGYVFGPGEAGTGEAVLMAGIGRFKVISVDYRMAPDFPYPAALDDAVAVYRELLKTTPAEKIGVFGTSTGGGMTLALTLRARAEGLPLPAAIAPG